MDSQKFRSLSAIAWPEPFFIKASYEINSDFSLRLRPKRRRWLNNASLTKKNVTRKIWRAERQAMKQAQVDLCAAEDKRFLDMFLKGDIHAH